MSVRPLLEALVAVRGVRSASVVGADGRVVDGVAGDGGDLQLVAQRVAAALGASRALSDLASDGELQQAFLEYEREPVLLAPLGAGEDDPVMVLTLHSVADLGRVRFQLRRTLPEVAAALRAEAGGDAAGPPPG